MNICCCSELYLAMLVGLNPMRTGRKTSKCSMQYCICPATYGADSPHVIPINTTRSEPSDASLNIFSPALGSSSGASWDVNSALKYANHTCKSFML